nr:FtsK/SpoIIIE domain-containing protein [Blastococcus sp. PRF04-17]
MIGLVDRPDRQLQEPLTVDLAEGGAWLAVGGARSGRTTLLRTVLGEAVHRLDPDELHVHVLESGGGSLAADAAGLPHTGTAVGGEDALRAVRLVDRLATEVAARRAGPHDRPAPRILLLVDGLEAFSALLDEHDPGRGSTALLRLARDGAAAGLTCVITADRAVPGGRLAALARQRLVLPLPDRADYAMAGVPARAVPSHRPPGRALLGEEATECQLTLPRPLTEARGGPVSSPPPLRIAELPPEPVLTVPGAAPPRWTERSRCRSAPAGTTARRRSWSWHGPAACWSPDRRVAADRRHWTPSPTICAPAVRRSCASACRRSAARDGRPRTPSGSDRPTSRASPTGCAAPPVGRRSWSPTTSGPRPSGPPSTVCRPWERPTGSSCSPPAAPAPSRRTTRDRSRHSVGRAPVCCSAPAPGTPTCSACGCRGRRSPSARAPAGW